MHSLGFLMYSLSSVHSSLSIAFFLRLAVADDVEVFVVDDDDVVDDVVVVSSIIMARPTNF